MKKWQAILFWLICSIATQAALAQTTVTAANASDLKAKVESAADNTTVTLGSSFPATLGSVIALNIDHAYNIIIDGDQGGSPIELTAGGSFKHFRINKTASGGSLTFRNIAFKGRRTATDIANDTLGPSGGGIDIGGSANSATYRFENTRFSGISGRAIFFANTPVEITDSTFENNTAEYAHGGAIFGSGDLTIERSTFVGNSSRAPAEYSGGAIGLLNYGNTATIKNSVFLNNKTYTRGGAISLHLSQGGKLIVDHSYFEGNQTTTNSNISDGGAISIFGQDTNLASLELTHSTFYNNTAADDGGAVFLQNNHASAQNTIRNCTMVGNHAKDFNDPGSHASGGGAIQLSLNTTATLENNTIAGNKSTYKGGGLGVHVAGGTPRYYLNNNIIVGNTLTNPSGSNQANVAASFLGNLVTGSFTNNLGLDNGTPTTVTPERVFGVGTPPPPAANQNALMIGNPNDSATGHYRKLDTLLILPNDADFPGDTAGMADNTAALASMQVSVDQRGFPRNATTPDIGAVEIVWVRFNANGGQWSGGVLPPGSNGYHIPGGSASGYDRYYSITHYGGATVVTPSTPNPPASPSGQTFAGWYVDNGSFDTPWNPSTPITGDTKVIARWMAPAAPATVQFDGNGADFGSVASMASTVGSNITLPPNGFIKANYAFMGWDTDPAGAGTRRQPGETFPVTQMSQTLYAWWTPVPVGTYTVTYTSSLPGVSNLPVPSTGIVAGATYTVSSIVPSLGGYTFTGWQSSHGSAIYNLPASFTMPSENVTLTAQWTPTGGGGGGSAKNIPLTPAAGWLLMALGIAAAAGVAIRRRKTS